jgi:hypothetical protein
MTFKTTAAQRKNRRLNKQDDGFEWRWWTLPKEKTGIYNQCGLGRNPSRLRGNPGP